jgi:hypothetical protein
MFAVGWHHYSDLYCLFLVCTTKLDVITVQIKYSSVNFVQVPELLYLPVPLDVSLLLVWPQAFLFANLGKAEKVWERARECKALKCLCPGGSKKKQTKSKFYRSLVQDNFAHSVCLKLVD